MLFRTLRRRSPGFRAGFWRAWYDLLATVVPRSDWTFMNYGWRDPASSPEAGDPATAAWYALHLYLRTASAIPLRSRDVVEVGCGRGGGAAAVREALSPSRMVGLDFSPRAVALCQRVHRAPGLEFMIGDAQALPFVDASFDAVLSVESTHCYRSFPTFLSEVRRVLRPGGHLLLADFRDASAMPAFVDAIARCGLEKIAEEDLTPGVLAALDATHGDKVRRVGAIPAPLRRVVLSFAAARGTDTYRDFRDGQKTYLRFVLKKP